MLMAGRPAGLDHSRGLPETLRIPRTALQIDASSLPPLESLATAKGSPSIHSVFQKTPPSDVTIESFN